MADFIRARSPEHKEERKQAIMAAADKLFLTCPYHDITLSSIAQEVGLSRANLYKYAQTKEEIYLWLHAKCNEAYFDDLLNALQSGSFTNRQFAKKWAKVTAQHDAFLRYQDVLISILEANVSLDALVEFKRNFARICAPIDSLLAQQCGLEDTQRAHDLFRCLLYQASGLRNLYACSDLTKEAMAIAGLSPVEGSFERAYEDFVLMCLDSYSENR